LGARNKNQSHHSPVSTRPACSLQSFFGPIFHIAVTCNRSPNIGVVRIAQEVVDEWPTMRPESRGSGLPAAAGTQCSQPIAAGSPSRSSPAPRFPHSRWASLLHRWFRRTSRLPKLHHLYSSLILPRNLCYCAYVPYTENSCICYTLATTRSRTPLIISRSPC